jgi:hypothetical protein
MPTIHSISRPLTQEKILRPMLLVLAASLVGGCDLGLPRAEGEAPIDRETFVVVFTDLRVEAHAWDSGQVPEEARDRILAEHGVTEDDLRAFIHVHGRDVPFMNEIWAEVMARVRDRVEPRPEDQTEVGTGEELPGA